MVDLLYFAIVNSFLEFKRWNRIIIDSSALWNYELDKHDSIENMVVYSNQCNNSI